MCYSEGSEREFKEAHKHLEAAVMLAKLHEEQGIKLNIGLYTLDLNS